MDIEIPYVTCGCLGTHPFVSVKISRTILEFGLVHVLLCSGPGVDGT